MARPRPASLVLVLLLAGCPEGWYGEDDTSPGTEADLGRGGIAVDPRTDVAFALRRLVGDDCSTTLYVDALRPGAARALPFARLSDRFHPRMLFPEGSVALLGGNENGESAELELYDPQSFALLGRYQLDAWPATFALDESGRLMAATIPREPMAEPEPEPLEVPEGALTGADGAGRGDERAPAAPMPPAPCPLPSQDPHGPQRAVFVLDSRRLERVHLEVDADGMRLGWRAGHRELLVVAEDAPTVPEEAQLRVLSYGITPGDSPAPGAPMPQALSTTSLPVAARFALVLEGVRIARTTLSAERARLASDPGGRYAALPVDVLDTGHEKCPRGPTCVRPAVLLVDHERRAASVLRGLQGPVGFAGDGVLVGWALAPSTDPREKKRETLQLVALGLDTGDTASFEVLSLWAPSLAFLPDGRVLAGSVGWRGPLTLVDVRRGTQLQLAGASGDLSPFAVDERRGAVWLIDDDLVHVDLERATAASTWLPFTPSAISLLPGTGEVVLRRGLEPWLYLYSPGERVWGSARGAARLRAVRLGSAGEDEPAAPATGDDG